MAVGPPKSGKTTFSKYFAIEAAKVQRPVSYVTIDEPPEEVEQSFSDILIDSNLKEMIQIVDCYSWRTGLASTSNFVTVNPKNLNELSIALDKLAKNMQKQCFIVDSLSSLILDSGQEPTRKFLQLFLARMKAYNALCLSTLQKGVHADDLEQTLRFMFDGILELRVEDQNSTIERFIRIYAMRGVTYSSEWQKLAITPTGLKLPGSNALSHSIYHLKSPFA